MPRPLSPLRPIALDQHRTALGFAAIAVAATLWAIAAIVARRIFDAGVSPNELAMVRTVIAALGLALISQGLAGNRRWGDWRIWALGLSLALVTVTYYVAINRLAVAVAVVIQYTAPALVMCLNAVRRQKLPPLITVLAAIAALVGVMLVSGLGESHLRLDGLGLLAAGLSALFFANNVLLNEALVDQYGAIGVVARGFMVSSLFWVGIQISQGVPTSLFQPEVLPGIAFVGIGGTLIPFSLLCWGIQQVQAERGAIAATLEPVMAAGLAWVGLGQTLTLLQMMGGALVIGAVTLLQTRQADSAGARAIAKQPLPPGQP